jgi:hypothetical protein
MSTRLIHHVSCPELTLTWAAQTMFGCTPWSAWCCVRDEKEVIVRNTECDKFTAECIACVCPRCASSTKLVHRQYRTSCAMHQWRAMTSSASWVHRRSHVGRPNAAHTMHALMMGFFFVTQN